LDLQGPENRHARGEAMKLVWKYFKSNPHALSCYVYVGREKNDYSDS